jgi:tRNA G18 (ribose-2'-O)-methylase SpoU
MTSTVLQYRTLKKLPPEAPPSWDDFDYSIRPKETDFTTSETAVAPPCLVRPADIPAAIDLLKPLISADRLKKMDSILEKRSWEVTFLFEAPTNPSNVYACLRTLDSFGIQSATVIINTNTVIDPKARVQYMADNRTSRARPPSNKSLATMRTAAGSAQWIDLHLTTDSPTDVVAALKEKGYGVFATAVDVNAVDVRDVVWPGLVEKSSDSTAPATTASPPLDNKVCIVMGSEDSGISDEMRLLADVCFYLPMSGFAESYNLSVATSLTCAFMSSAGILVPSKEKGEKYVKDESARRDEEVRLKWMMASLPKAHMAESILRRGGLEIVS